MSDHFNDQIKFSKKILREKSHNFANNFKKIEKFIKNEVEELEKLKKLSKPIIPDINFSELSNKNHKIKENVMKRGEWRATPRNSQNVTAAGSGLIQRLSISL